MRVVSLLPSATEILYAIGAEPVAVSETCDYPPEARALPNATATRIDTDGSSAEIDAEVTGTDTEDGGVYELDEAVLAETDPDLIVTQGVCDVCAVEDTFVRETVAELGLDAELLSVHVHSLDDLLAAIERIGELTGRSAAASSLVADLESRIERVRRRTPDGNRRVVVADWLDPVMVAGHWVPEMVDLAGGSYGMAGPGDRSRPRRFEDLVAYDPEILVLAPCGFPLEQTLQDLDAIRDREGYDRLTAVRDGEVYAMDGNQYVNRPGPRLVDTLEYLGGIVHSEAVDPPPDDVVARVSTANPRVE